MAEVESAGRLSITDADPHALTRTVLSWLRANLPEVWVEAIDADDQEALARAREQVELGSWWERLADAGLVTPAWPSRYGGLGLSPALASLVMGLLRQYKVPRFRENAVGVNLAGPAIRNWGVDWQKERFLRPIAHNQEIWCQMFSEPSAGSDLAGLATSAVRDGDLWLVSGTKIWTSFAHVAHWGLLLARTDPNMPKHRGMTAFIIPVRQDRVTVRPLRHLTGDAEFNEVFLDQAEVPDRLRLGEPGKGWEVATSILTSERVAASGIGATLPGAETGRSVQNLLARHSPVGNQELSDRMAGLWAESELVRVTNLRAAANRKAGRPAGSQSSVTKLFQSHHTQRLQHLALDLEDLGGQAWAAEDRWARNTAWAFLRVRMKTIGAGTSEVQRSIIGERVLGLPKEPAVDSDVPWKDVLRS